MKLKKGIKIISYFVVMLLLCVLMPMNIANAVTSISKDVSKGNIVISKSGNYLISGVTNKYTILVKKGVTANITFQSVEITTSEDNIYPLKIEDGANANIILKGDNRIKNNNDHAINVLSGGKLTIASSSTGTLTATGGIEGAGIGGSGSINIKGGTIKAIGGLYGNGIGFGISSKSLWENSDKKAGSITISGGDVAAVGGKNASAGIGYSSTKTKGKITITGGNVYATSGSAGIGGYALDAGNDITISGGNVTAIGNAYSAGIGNNISLKNTTVKISGGTITAISDRGEVLYDSNYYPSVNDCFDVAADNIIITGGMTFFDSCSSEPKNASGESLRHKIYQSKSGKIKKILVNEATYGIKDMECEGILSLWLPTAKTNTFLEVEFVSGSKTKISKADYNQYTKLPENMNFDLSVSDIELYSNLCIYNNKIYDIMDKNTTIEVTGTTSNHQIIVHSGNHRIEFNNLNVDYTKQSDKDFFVISPRAKVLVHLKNKNMIKTGNDSIGFYVGQNAELSFTASSVEDSLMLESKENSNSIYTSNGRINQYGGTISIKAEQNSFGIYLGNRGVFKLYDGVCNGSSENSVLAGSNYTNVIVHGGTLNVDTIGCLEEVTDLSNQNFTITNGQVNVSNRMIFTKFFITGGTINTHLLGSGIGTDITMYGGKVLMDQFITDYSSVYDKEKGKYVSFQYETPNGVSKESMLDDTNIYGGEIKETHNVTVDELKKIQYGHQ